HRRADTPGISYLRPLVYHCRCDASTCLRSGPIADPEDPACGENNCLTTSCCESKESLSSCWRMGAAHANLVFNAGKRCISCESNGSARKCRAAGVTRGDGGEGLCHFTL